MAASLEGIETQGRGRTEGEEKEAEKEEEENMKERKVVRIDAVLFFFCWATSVKMNRLPRMMKHQEAREVWTARVARPAWAA